MIRESYLRTPRTQEETHYRLRYRGQLYADNEDADCTERCAGQKAKLVCCVTQRSVSNHRSV